MPDMLVALALPAPKMACRERHRIYASDHLAVTMQKKTGASTFGGRRSRGFKVRINSTLEIFQNLITIGH